jgi:hypothetical protein
MDDRFLVLGTTGPSPILLVGDHRLKPVTKRRWPPDEFATSRVVSDCMLAFSIKTLSIISIPELRVRESLDLEPDVLQETFGWHAPALAACRSTWVAVNFGGQVVQIKSAPLRLGRAGRAATRQVRGVAVDEPTKTLVILGSNTVEVYSLEKMTTVKTCAVDGEVGYSACAGNGKAWIATDKMFLHLDLASATFAGRTILARENGGRGLVTLDLAASGRYLAASAHSFVKHKQWETVLKVFRVDGGALREVASARTALEGKINDLTLIEKEDVVVVCTSVGAFGWHYGTRGDEEE